MRDFLQNKKHLSILKSIGSNENIIMLDVSKQTNITYSHVVKLIKQMNSDNILKMDKNGRVVHIHLTQKGRQLLTNALKVEELLG